MQCPKARLEVAVEDVHAGCRASRKSEGRVFFTFQSRIRAPVCRRRSWPARRRPFYEQEIWQGTGAGLSQVYGFIAQSGGDVVIDSEEGAGTTINMYLPVVEGANRMDGVLRPTNVWIRFLSWKMSPMRWTPVFRSIGYEVVTALRC